MRPRGLVRLYRLRLRAHAVQELLAGIGVAVAVALIFAVLVANANIAKSTSEVVHTVIGPASLQLRARGEEGFDERIASRVAHLPGVTQAAGVLELPATLVGADGRRVTVDAAGAEVSLTTLDGLAHTLPNSVLSARGVALSEASAKALGLAGRSATSSGAVSMRVRGRTFALPITTVLGQEAVGVLSRTVVAIMPLELLQQLAGLPGRISRVLVQTERGQERAVRGELERVASGGLTVAAADQDVALLREALRPSDLASGLFAAIAGLLGVLFAFNATLLTIPERRQAIADRRPRTRRSAIAQMVLFQAVCLGLVASVVGVLLGYALSKGAFRPATGYLSQAFALGGRTTVGASSVLIAVLGGVLASCLASAVLLLDLRRGRPHDAVYFEQGVPGNALSMPAQRWLVLGALALLAMTTVVFALAPGLTLLATAVLAMATVLAVPLALTATLRAMGALARRRQGLTTLPVALTALKTTTLRSLALAATGALALFGAVALGGARDDLLQGLHRFADTYTAAADLWVVNQGDALAVDGFLPDGYASGVGAVHGVASVESLQSQFLDIGDRRVWLTARKPAETQRLLEGQVVEGSARIAVRRLGEGGWITASRQLAAEQHARVGDILRLPTPSGEVPFKLAALTTNFGWAPGAVLMADKDHERLWASSTPTALGVHLERGANPSRVRRAIVAALGPNSGLEVLGAGERSRRFVSIAREGLGQLQQIAFLLVAAAVLALAAGVGAAIWQRRPWLSERRLSGVKRSRLRGVLFTEALLMLGAGCLTGLLAGIYGEIVVDAYLKRVTGLPVAGVTASWRLLEILAGVVAVVVGIVTVPVISASRVSAELALEE